MQQIFQNEFAMQSATIFLKFNSLGIQNISLYSMIALPAPQRIRRRRRASLPVRAQQPRYTLNNDDSLNSYESLLRLDDTIVKKGLSSAKKNKLATKKCTKACDCCVCMDKIKVRQQCTALPCHHVFQYVIWCTTYSYKHGMHNALVWSAYHVSHLSIWNKVTNFIATCKRPWHPPCESAKGYKNG